MRVTSLGPASISWPSSGSQLWIWLIIHGFATLIFCLLLWINIRDLRVQLWAERRQLEKRRATSIWARGAAIRGVGRVVRSLIGLFLGVLLWYAKYTQDLELRELFSNLLPILLNLIVLIMLLSGISELYDRYRFSGPLFRRNLRLWKRAKKSR